MTNRLRVVAAMNSAELLHDLFSPTDLADLAEVVDLDPHVVTDVASEESIRALASAQVLLTGWGAPRVDATMLESAPELGWVIHTAGTVRRLVSPQLWQRGIRVSNAADANAIPVAEYALAMVLLAAKRVLPAVAQYTHSQAFPTWLGSRSFGNNGAVVGVVGASRTGRRLIEMLRPFDHHVLVADPTVSAAQAQELGVELVSLEDLLRRSAVVTLHVPLLPSTRGLIGARELALMAPGATLINTARGAVVETEALVAHLRGGRGFAVLDVTDPEPLPSGHPLFDLPEAILTPHISGSLGNELRRLGASARSEVDRVRCGLPLRYEVTEQDEVFSA